MAQFDEEVMAFVEKTLKKNPNMELADLFERAKKVSTSVAKLSKRQFNARYPLQVKRKRALAVRKRTGGVPPRRVSSASRSKTKTPTSNSDPRETVRQVFLQFATDITGAEERKDLVRVLANVDQYVNRVMKGVS